MNQGNTIANMRHRTMIHDARELTAMRERLAWFQSQLSLLRDTEPNAANYRAAASGYLAEVDRMQLEVREYLAKHSS